MSETDEPSSLFDLCIKYIIENLKNRTWTPSLFENIPSFIIEKIIKELQIQSQLSDAVLPKLFISNLQNLILDHYDADCKITEKSLSFLPFNCINLRKLKLHHRHSIDQFTIQKLLLLCSNLQYLRVSCQESLRDLTPFPDQICCTDLRVLCLEECKMVSSKSLSDIVKKCTRLESINLQGCVCIRSSALIEMATHCKQLKKLNLAGLECVNDNVLIEITRNCRDLEKIDLSWCEELTDVSVTQLVSQCTKIRTLRLRKCNELTDLTMHAISNHLYSTLTYLDVMRCENFSDEAVSELSEKCTKLKHLKLSWDSNIENETVVNILTRLKDLQVLCLVGCKNLNDGCLFPILEMKLPLENLRVLNFAWCNEVSDDILKKMKENYPAIKVINYFGEAM